MEDIRTSISTVAVSGASGLVGATLGDDFARRGVSVKRLVRRAPRNAAEIEWNPTDGNIDAMALGGVDAVVHLAGENIAQGRWTAAKKTRIRESRVEGTRLLAEAIASLDARPKILVCASAIGYYGDRGDETLDESSPPGEGFLAEVCKAWEDAAAPANAAGVRVVNLRFGVILSGRGGALKKMLLPFKLGLGGRIGSGRQWMSWIALDDAVRAIEHAISTGELSGPVNAVAPHPVTNAEFTKSLGRVLGRPTIFPLPAFAARLALGEMAGELLLASARVIPEKLSASGFCFECAQIENALRRLLLPRGE